MLAVCRKKVSVPSTAQAARVAKDDDFVSSGVGMTFSYDGGTIFIAMPYQWWLLCS